MSLPKILAAYPDDAPIGELRTPEHFIIHVLRLWNVQDERTEPGDGPWSDGFRMAGIGQQGTGAFVSLTRIVEAASRRRLDIRCPRCPQLGADEGRFLQAIALAQHGRSAESALVLGDWLPSSALRAAIGPLEVLAAALAARRLKVPLRHAAVVLPGDLRIPANAGRGLSLVH
ncbi:MAG: hypothetical protein AB7K86_11290 [Rhodospirillales bacterium]